MARAGFRCQPRFNADPILRALRLPRSILATLSVSCSSLREGSDCAAVMLGGSSGGIPEGLARRLAENGVSAFALGYFGAPGLPPALIEIPIIASSEASNCSAGDSPNDRASASLGCRREPSWLSSWPRSWEAQSTESRCRSAVACRLVRAESTWTRRRPSFNAVQLGRYGVPVPLPALPSRHKAGVQRERLTATDVFSTCPGMNRGGRPCPDRSRAVGGPDPVALR